MDWKIGQQYSAVRIAVSSNFSIHDMALRKEIMNRVCAMRSPHRTVLCGALQFDVAQILNSWCDPQKTLHNTEQQCIEKYCGIINHKKCL